MNKDQDTSKAQGSTMLEGLGQTIPESSLPNTSMDFMPRSGELEGHLDIEV